MKVGIQGRTVLANLALVALVVAMLTGAALYHFQHSLEALSAAQRASMEESLKGQLTRDLRRSVAFLVERVTNPLYQSRLSELGQILAGFRERADVSYAVVFDSAGQVVHDGTPTLDRYGRPFEDEFGRNAAGLRATVIRETPELLDMMAPVFFGDRQIGGVRVGISLESIHKSIAEAEARLNAIGAHWQERNLLTVLLIALGLALISGAIAIATARRLTRPVRELAASAQRIGQGDYGATIAVSRHDEIGDLARAFRQMATDLQRTTVSKQHVDSIVTNIGDMLFVLDLQGRVRSVNPAAVETLGLAQEALIGRPLADLFSIAAGSDPGWRLPATGPVWKGDLHLVRADGSTVPAMFSVARLAGPLQERQGYVAVGTDISSRLLAEQALRQAKEAAEEASAAKSKFLASITHELRTPIASMIGFADLILRGGYGTISQDVHDAVAMIRRSGDAFLGLINDLLDITRVESGQLRLDLLEIDPCATLSDAVQSMVNAARQRKLELQLRLPEALPAVRIDPIRIAQVVRNLLDNAIKFSERGVIEVVCTGDCGGLRCSVTDSGVGIPQESLERVFDQFLQSGYSKRHAGEGAGLGLPISKRIIEAHGGRIWAESHPGHGTTITFTLPALAAP